MAGALRMHGSADSFPGRGGVLKRAAARPSPMPAAGSRAAVPDLRESVSCTPASGRLLPQTDVLFSAIVDPHCKEGESAKRPCAEWREHRARLFQMGRIEASAEPAVNRCEQTMSLLASTLSIEQASKGWHRRVIRTNPRVLRALKGERRLTPGSRVTPRSYYFGLAPRLFLSI